MRLSEWTFFFFFRRRLPRIEKKKKKKEKNTHVYVLVTNKEGSHEIKKIHRSVVQQTVTKK